MLYFSIQRRSYTRSTSIKNTSNNTRRKLKVIQVNEKSWLLNKCSCFKWCKEYVCKHTLAFAERKKFFTYPVASKDIKIGSNRRRGSPRLTAAALDYQNGEVIEECVYSDTESEHEREIVSKKSKKRKPVQSESEEEYDIFKPTQELEARGSIIKIGKKSKEPVQNTTKVTKAAAKISKPVVQTRSAKRAKTGNY